MFMKLNWGYFVIALYSVFVFGILFAVVRSFSHKPQLVMENYYDLDIGYQKRLDNSINTQSLKEKPYLNVKDSRIFLMMPESMKGSKGKVKLICPGQSKEVDFEEMYQEGMDTRYMKKGRWYYEFEWESGGKEFFISNHLTI
jgi:hypothetical protein